MTAGTERRVADLRPVLSDRGLDVMIVTSAENRRYLTGFSGSAGWAVIGQDPDAELDSLFTDFRYVEQARIETTLAVRRCGRFPEADVLPRLSGNGLRVGLEAETLSYATYSRIAAALGAAGHAPEPADGLVEGLRAVKDAGELALIGRAAAVADQLMMMVPTLFRQGMSELDLARELVIAARRLGSSREAFDTIVASGPRSALAHGRPTDRVPGDGDLVLIDLGAVVDGYCSDISRTFVVGTADGRQIGAHQNVLDAQRAALGLIRPGAVASEVDAGARDSLAAAGIADRFGHSLGHGVGLALGELPRLMPKCDEVLLEGMVTTVEPGAYWEGWGGIRIEDLIQITGDGFVSLTAAPRGLVSLG